MTKEEKDKEIEFFIDNISATEDEVHLDNCIEAVSDFLKNENMSIGILKYEVESHLIFNDGIINKYKIIFNFFLKDPSKSINHGDNASSMLNFIIWFKNYLNQDIK